MPHRQGQEVSGIVGRQHSISASCGRYGLCHQVYAALQRLHLIPETSQNSACHVENKLLKTEKKKKRKKKTVVEIRLDSCVQFACGQDSAAQDLDLKFIESSSCSSRDDKPVLAKFNSSVAKLKGRTLHPVVLPLLSWSGNLELVI